MSLLKPILSQGNKSLQVSDEDLTWWIPPWNLVRWYWEIKFYPMKFKYLIGTYNYRASGRVQEKMENSAENFAK